MGFLSFPSIKHSVIFMNAKTAKLINRYSRMMQRNPRAVRKHYNRQPRSKRFEIKEEMRQTIDEHV